MKISSEVLSVFSEFKLTVGRMMLAIFGEGGGYYINGAELLPPPLSAGEEAEILRKFDDDRSLSDVLIKHNLRLVVYIAKKFETTSVGLEDLISIGTIGLVKAVGSFKSDKNIKLATYASRCIENEILMYLRKVNARPEVSLDEPLNTDWDGNELLLSDVIGSPEDDVLREIEKREEKEMIHRAINNLCERERKIIMLRYGFGSYREYTQNEVAEMMGISQSYISRLEKRIISKLKKEIIEFM
jgi:RNA polymerase sporulation-specific sigma factor